VVKKITALTERLSELSSDADALRSETLV